METRTDLDNAIDAIAKPDPSQTIQTKTAGISNSNFPLFKPDPASVKVS